MPEGPEQRFAQIHSLLLNTPVDRVRLSAEVVSLQREFQTILASTQEYSDTLRQLEEKLKKLSAPPLVHAVFIAPSQTTPDACIVAVGGQRMELGLALSGDAPVTPQNLHAGDEVLVTRDSNVIVAVVGPGRRGDAAEVRDVLEDLDTGRKDRALVRCSGSENTVVELSARLQELTAAADGEQPALKAGDKVLVDLGAKIAFEKLPSHETGELELEKDPKARYEDIAGLDHHIAVIKDVIETPYLHRERFVRYGLKRPHGILLHGPPGCGKTMIGAAAANGLRESIHAQLDMWIQKLQEARTLPGSAAADLLVDAPKELGIDPSHPGPSIERLRSAKRQVHSYFLNVKGPELLSKWVGEAESRVRQIFVEAKRKASYTCPVIVFFDEIESMFQRRGSGVSSDMEKTMVPQMLAELDGVEALENVIVIGASNRHELLDPGLLRPGRLDIKIKIDRPDRYAAAAIFRIHLWPRDNPAGVPLSSEGHVEQSCAAFDEAVAQVLDSIGRHGGLLALTGANTAPELVPLSRILTPAAIVAISLRLRDSAIAGAPNRS